MTYIFIVLAVLAVAAAVVVIRSARYGGLRQAFDAKLAADRKTLAETRGHAKRTDKARQAELAKAAKELSAAQAAYDGGIRQGAATVAALENPGTGHRLTKLGPVELHEHAVVLKKAAVPLLGLQARVESASETSYLYLRLSDGREMQHGFSTAWRGTGNTKMNVQEHGGYNLVTATEKQKQDFSDEQVRHLCTIINNAAITEQQFVEDLPAMLAQARTDMATAHAATGPVVERGQNLAQVGAGSSLADEAEAARSRLAEAEAAWLAKTSG
jgi:hypothetical protein